MNLPKGMLQDWSYILLAKYRELLSLQVNNITNIRLKQQVKILSFLGFRWSGGNA